MRTAAIFSAIFGLTAVSAQHIGTIGVPKTIKAGEKFSIKGLKNIQQGRYDKMVTFGIQGPTTSDTPYQAGDVGDLFAGPFDMDQFSDQQWNLTIPDVSINTDKKGPATITATVVSFMGAFHQVSLSTFKVETEIGDSTSEEYNESSERGPVCSWVN